MLVINKSAYIRVVNIFCYKMRRRAGIGAIQKQKLATEKFKDKGNEIQENQLEQLTKLMDTFRANLEEFAANHKKEIKKNAQFRRQFQGDLYCSSTCLPLADYLSGCSSRDVRCNRSGSVGLRKGFLERPGDGRLLLRAQRASGGGVHGARESMWGSDGAGRTEAATDERSGVGPEGNDFE